MPLFASGWPETPVRLTPRKAKVTVAISFVSPAALAFLEWPPAGAALSAGGAAGAPRSSPYRLLNASVAAPSAADITGVGATAPGCSPSRFGVALVICSSHTPASEIGRAH